MKRSTTGRIVPAAILTIAGSVPVVTVLNMLTHVHSTTGSSTGGAQLLTTGGTSGNSSSQSSSATPTSASTTQAKATATPTSTKAVAVAAATTHTYIGTAVSDPFGVVQARVTTKGNRIVDVSILAPMDSPRSAAINQQAVPMLRSETLQAQSAQIDGVSGATFTSQAYEQSLQSALDQARSQA